MIVGILDAKSSPYVHEERLKFCGLTRERVVVICRGEGALRLPGKGRRHKWRHCLRRGRRGREYIWWPLPDGG